MDHTALNERLFALHDGELTEADRREAEAHLASCAACRQRYQAWEQTAKVLFRPPTVEGSEAFAENVLAHIRTIQRARRRWGGEFGLRWTIPAAACAVGLLLAFQPLRSGVSLEALLLEERTGRPSHQWMLASEPPNTDDVLGLVLGGSE